MLIMNRKRYFFRFKEIWFSDSPYDVDGCDSVLFRACKNGAEKEGFSRKEFTTLVIDLTRDTDTLWRNIDKGHRYEIGRAGREGIKIALSGDHEGFYGMYKRFSDKRGFSPNLGIRDIVEKYGTLFSAIHNDTVLAYGLFLEDSDNIRWLVGVSPRLEADPRRAVMIGYANKLLMWETMLYAKKKAIKEFDLGGYYAGPVKNRVLENVNFFKKRFGVKPAVHYIFEKDYSGLLRLLKKIRGYFKSAPGGKAGS